MSALLGTQLTQACSVPFGVLALVDRGWCAGAGKEGQVRKVWQPWHVGSTSEESGCLDGAKIAREPSCEARSGWGKQLLKALKANDEDSCGLTHLRVLKSWARLRKVRFQRSRLRLD